ncbi:MAG: class I SAM-dependent methyltransferase [Oscillospiraceae bacterium]|jgi:tRNA (cmo5U34)-methyltransferase|nr:class I SAM-dependent methyltransferase [Oscillospiraceae bacterium]
MESGIKKLETNEHVKNRFNAIASEYEAARRKFIPGFDTFYESGIRFLRCETPTPRVLDLGAGTGLYSLKLLERYPRAKITLLDFAGNMLTIAGQIFSGNPNISFIQDDYFRYCMPENRM